MGAPVSGMKAAEESSAESLLDALRNVAATERRKHATVLNYWLSIRGDRHFPPIRDLDPLEISDAGPSSVLLELIGGGEDAEIRHLGQAIKGGVKVERISEAPRPSLLSCVAKQLPIVASARKAIAFEDEFATAEGASRCWVTLLPFSSTGTYVDYVYGFVTLESAAAEAKAEPEPEPEAEAEAPEASALEGEEGLEAVVDEPEAKPEPAAEAEIVEEAEAGPEPVDEAEPAVEPEPEEVPEAQVEPVAEAEPQEVSEAEPEEPAHAEPNEKQRPGFSKLFDAIAGVGGFYGNVVQMDPKLPTSTEPQELDEPAERLDEPVSVSQGEGHMQTILAEVRSKADEARMAKLRSNIALYEGLSAAYDFALEAEDHPEEYLKLVEAQGLKIQLRSPMAPVVKLAFDGMCDDSTIAQLEKVLAWALKNDLPRGSLAERIEAEGGLGSILNGKAAA
ncbi:MAG: hypothetical protein HOP96_04375 [Sphingomonas sp.]|nr:hypothetical protein [Sphingomonas sp.]